MTKGNCHNRPAHTVIWNFVRVLGILIPTPQTQPVFVMVTAKKIQLSALGYLEMTSINAKAWHTIVT